MAASFRHGSRGGPLSPERTCSRERPAQIRDCHGRDRRCPGLAPDKAGTGCLIEVPSGETVARGFAMPRSPRVYQGRIWLLDSGKGRLVVVEPSCGEGQRGG